MKILLMMLAALLGGALVGGIVGYQLGRSKSPAIAHEQQQASSQGASIDRQPTFQEQLECSAAVERQFKKDGWTEKDHVSVISHYSPRLGHCYGMYSMIGSSLDHDVTMSRNVFDGVEGTNLGTGDWTHSQWADGKRTCYVIEPVTGKSLPCGSTQDFESLAYTQYGLNPGS